MSDGQERDLDREYLDFLSNNYEKLHNAVWEAHRTAWSVTRIFVPVTSAGVGYYIKEHESLTPKQILIGAGILILIIWFWYAMLRILERFNKTRFTQLRRLENAVNARFADVYIRTKYYKSAEFKQYNLKYWGWLSFDTLSFSFAVLLTILIALGIADFFGGSDFSERDFKSQAAVSVLCNEIQNSGLGIIPIAPFNTVEWLNEVLTTPDLYDRVRDTKPDFRFSGDVEDLALRTKQNRGKYFSALHRDEKDQIKRLNRLVLEDRYLDIVPRQGISSSLLAWVCESVWRFILSIFVLVVVLVKTGVFKVEIEEQRPLKMSKSTLWHQLNAILHVTGSNECKTCHTIEVENTFGKLKFSYVLKDEIAKSVILESSAIPWICQRRWIFKIEELGNNSVLLEQRHSLIGGAAIMIRLNKLWAAVCCLFRSHKLSTEASIHKETKAFFERLTDC